MFDSMKENIPEDLKRLFVFNKTVHSYETRSSQMFHIPQGKTLQFDLKTLSYDCTNLWNKFYHPLLHEELDLTKSKLKNLLKIHFLNTYA